MWVDALDFAIGTTLVLQCLESKVCLPVEYLSHWLSEAESQNSATGREFTALISALCHWHHYLVDNLLYVLITLAYSASCLVSLI